MADLNALIAQGAQFNLPNPVDQYSKVMQLQSAQQQMQLNREQMQQIQEDRAGFAKLRTTLADKNLTPEQYELALINSPSKDHQRMGLELRSRRNLLAEYDKAQKESGVGVEPPMAPAEVPAPMAAPVEMPAAKTFDTSAVMVAPVQKPYSEMSNKEKILYNEWTGRGRQPQPATAAYAVDGQQVPFNEYVNANIANSAGAGARAAMAAMPNALAAQVAPAEPVANAMLAQPPAAASVGNAMASKQAQIAEINKQLKIATSPRFAEVPNIDKEIARLERQLKQLTENKYHVVDGNLVDETGKAIFTAAAKPPTQSELARLMSERAALIASGAALTDNRVVAYDNAITKASAPSAGQPSDVTRLIAERNAAVTANRPADEIAALNAAIKKATTSTPPISVETKVNTYMPASEEAQRDFIKSTRATYDTLKNAPGTLKNIEEAIKLIPNAKGFMGPGGESLLDAASFLNNRLGTNINTKGITDATELRSRLFQGIIENLRKLDANPTENQQNAMRVALGNIGTDPNALPAVLNSFADTVRSKVDMHNAEVEGAVSRGVKFPYDPTIKLPTFTPPAPSGAALIPTGKPAAAAGEWKVVK